MKFKYKLIQVMLIGAALLYSSSTFASNLPSIAGEPPREAYTFLEKEIIYKVCAENKNNPDAKPDCRRLKTGAAASGVIIDHYRSPAVSRVVARFCISGSGKYGTTPGPL